MAARNTDVSVPAGTWTQLTDNDVTAITFQNKSKVVDLYVKGTVGANAPTTTAGAIRYEPLMGERNAAVADLFPGVAATRVYAWCSDAVDVFVSHTA